MLRRVSLFSLALGGVLALNGSARAADDGDLWQEMLFGDFHQEKGDDGEQQAADDEQQEADDDQDQQQGQQGQQGQQEQGAVKPGKSFTGHGDSGSHDPNVSLDPNLAGYEYFLGAWNCSAQATDANGSTVTKTKKVAYYPAFGGAWVGAAWGKVKGAVKHHHHHHNVAGVAVEGFDPLAQSYVKMAVTKSGAYGYAKSTGWQDAVFTWEGEAWNVHGTPHANTRVVITKADDKNYTVDVSVSSDGTTYDAVGSGSCARAL